MDKKQTQPKPETKQKPARKPGFWSNPWSSREVEVDDGMWHGPNPCSNSRKQDGERREK